MAVNMKYKLTSGVDFIMINILSKREKQLFKRSMRYIKPYKYKLLLLYISTILENIISLLPIFFMGEIINFTVKGEFDEIVRVIIMLVIIFIISTMLSFIETYLSNLLLNRISYSIKNELFMKVLKLPISKFDEVGTGHFLSLIEGDSNNIAQFYIDGILKVIISFITILVSLVFILKLSVSLSIIALVSFPITFLGYILFGKKLKHYSKISREMSDNYFRFFEESLKSIREIKCLNIEEKIFNQHGDFSSEFVKNNIKISIISMLSGFFSLAITSISEWLIILYGTWLIIKLKLSIGAYVAFNGYLGRFMSAVRDMLSINMTMQTTAVSLTRIYQLLNYESERYIKSTNIDKIQGSIKIENLKFKHNNSDRTILDDVSINIEPNSISVFVGVNGSGKSTLFDIITQLYIHSSGQIHIDNYNINDINLKSLRQNIAYIQQNPIIFNTSIKDNLLFANPEATLSEIKQACSKVCIDSYIESLPKKYDTIIGAGGIKLSGGEKQRLAIAMAILKKSKILLLDEVTSDLDGKSENYIVEILHKLSSNHTILMIAHRISSIVDIPNIYVIDEGRLVGYGDHKMLMSKCNIYRMMLGKQSFE